MTTNSGITCASYIDLPRVEECAQPSKTIWKVDNRHSIEWEITYKRKAVTPINNRANRRKTIKAAKKK